MNLETAFKAGQKGHNVGLPMGEGLKAVSAAINGIQRARIYSVAASPKGGKSTLVDSGFVVEPALFVIDWNNLQDKKLEEISKQLEVTLDPTLRADLNFRYEEVLASKIELEYIYLSYEIDRVSKEFDYLAHFLERDYGITTISLPEGKTHNKLNYVEMGSAYLRGELTYDKIHPNDEIEIIKVSDDLVTKIMETYKRRIVPLFGKYDSSGNLVEKGMIIFMENKDNPTGIRNFLLGYAKQHGEFLYTTYTKDGVQHSKMAGYNPKNPKKYVIVITDHLRKLSTERGYNTKATVDKFSEYAVEFRNVCKFSFVHIIHLGRAVGNIDRRVFDDDRLFPGPDDIKDTGNLSEDSNYIFTMFNPNDDKFNLKKHFGAIIRKPDNSLLYPNMRTIHLVESRHCFAPQHFRVNMYGGTKRFETLTI